MGDKRYPTVLPAENQQQAEQPQLGPLEIIGLCMVCLAVVVPVIMLLLHAALEAALIGGIIGFISPLAVIALASFGRVIHMAVKIIEPVFHRDLDRDGFIGLPPKETIRMIPVRGGKEVVMSGEAGGFDEEDLRFLVDHLHERGIAFRASGKSVGWKGVKLPSGRELSDYNDYRPFPDMLASLGILRNRKERDSGDLVTDDPAELRRFLGLS